jgi:hypothetical protein
MEQRSRVSDIRLFQSKTPVNYGIDELSSRNGDEDNFHWSGTTYQMATDNTLTLQLGEARRLTRHLRDALNIGERINFTVAHIK